MVVCRCRPFSEKEKNAGHSQISEIDLKSKTVRLKDPNQAKDVKQFTFDQVFDTDSTQQDVYETTAINIVDAVLGGFNGTVFVYGSFRSNSRTNRHRKDTYHARSSRFN